MVTTLTPIASVSEVVVVPAKELRPHPLAQRDMIKVKLTKITGALDLDAIGVLHGVRYPVHGETAIWLVDGQHRLQALLDNGMGEWPVHVMLHPCDSDARASQLFLALNYSSSVQTFAAFRNEILAGDPIANGVVSIARQHDFTISMATHDGNLSCVSALKRLYQRDNGLSLDATLGVVVAAWGRRSEAVEGQVVDGVCRVIAANLHNIDKAALVKKLAKYPGGPTGLLGSARGLRDLRRKAVALCVAEVVIGIYNSGRSTGRLDPL